MINPKRRSAPVSIGRSFGPRGPCWRADRLRWEEVPERAITLDDVFCGRSKRGLAAFIACHQEALAVSQRDVCCRAALSQRCGRRVAVGALEGWEPLSNADGLVLLLTQSALHSVEFLIAAVTALYAGQPCSPASSQCCSRCRLSSKGASLTAAVPSSPKRSLVLL